MDSEPSRRVARVDKYELSSLPSQWTQKQKGRYLRRLLRLQGIDPGRYCRIEYHPRQRCWIFSQEMPEAQVRTPQDDASYFEHVCAELRRTARAAFSTMAAHSLYFACNGGDYELPPTPQELTPADLAGALRGPGKRPPAARFDSEGGWQAKS